MAEYSTIATNTNGDWDLNTFARGNEAIKMMLENNLRAVSGTNIFDLDFGINIAFLKNDTESIIELLNSVHKTILDTAGIVEAEILQDKITIQNRTIHIPFNYKTINNISTSDVFITKI